MLPEEWTERLDGALLALVQTDNDPEVWSVFARLFFWRALYDYRMQLLAGDNQDKAALITSFIGDRNARA